MGDVTPGEDPGVHSVFFPWMKAWIQYFIA